VLKVEPRVMGPVEWLLMILEDTSDVISFVDEEVTVEMRVSDQQRKDQSL
jgi:hypothetical protein